MRIDHFTRALAGLLSLLLRMIKGSSVPNNVVITIQPNGTGFVALCDNYTITPAAANDWLTFTIATAGWKFVTAATPPAGRAGLRSPAPTRPVLPACGIWVDDPNINFTCVRFTAQSVVLHNSNADVATMPYHYYAVLMTNDAITIELDPMVRDRGGA